MYLISACLAGIKCKYNGGDNENKNVKALLKSGKAVPVCPEQLGGLSTPRYESEIRGGSGGEVLSGKAKVINKHGKDVSSNFIKGANETLKIALQMGASAAILKEGSPSCGSNEIYDGTFTGRKIHGEGVTTAILRSNGIPVYSEHNFPTLPVDLKKFYIGVVGAAQCSEKVEELAYEVGKFIALKGAVLICGGRTGVMEAAARGAFLSGGTTIGILPGNDKLEANQYIHLALATGLGEARNAVIARAADAVIAVSGGFGTLSEIALALKMGKPVVGLATWEIEGIISADCPEDAVNKSLELLQNRS